MPEKMNLNQVINDFYDALVKVRYPGVATVEPGNLEKTVLDKNLRNQLLHWLLVQSLKSIDSSANEPEADDDSLVHWYSYMGICSNKEALLGKCSIQDQLPTIVKLTGFIMNILGTNGETKIIPEAAENIIDYYLNNQVNIIPSSLKITKLSQNEARRYIKNINERVKEQKTCEAPDNVTKEMSEDTFDRVEENSHDTTAAIIEKFLKTFEDIKQWTKPTSIKSDEAKNLSFDNYIKDIDTNFLNLNETLKTKYDIGATKIPQTLNSEDTPLDQTVKNIVVRMENLNKVRDHDCD